MEEAVPDVDERVLVDVGVADPIGSHVVVVVVERDVVVVGLVLRHVLCGLLFSDCRNKQLQAGSRSAWLPGSAAQREGTSVTSDLRQTPR